MATRNDEDLALSRRAVAGDAAAFALLVDKYEAPLRSFLLRMGAGNAADDVAQEAFLKAWRRAAQYDGRARYSTWLTTIAWRCRLDQLRREKQEPPSEVNWKNEAADELQDMLARLTDSDRASLVLCDGHGWTHAEAADLLGMPLGTLKSTVARAKGKCRKMWSADNG